MQGKGAMKLLRLPRTYIKTIFGLVYCNEQILIMGKRWLCDILYSLVAGWSSFPQDSIWFLHQFFQIFHSFIDCIEYHFFDLFHTKPHPLEVQDQKYCISLGKVITSSLSSLALCFFGSFRNSSVNRRHSWTFSGDTKSTATFVHDCLSGNRIMRRKIDDLTASTISKIKMEKSVQP